MRQVSGSRYQVLGIGLFYVSCFMFHAVGCAPIQAYHPATANLVRPGTGSARVEYGSVAGYVNGYTTTPEQSIGAISNANLRDSQAWVLRECYSRYGWRCNAWGYGGRYSRPGYTLGGMEAVEGWRAGQHGDRLAREALRGAKLSADLTLRQSDVLERTFNGKQSTPSTPVISSERKRVERSPAVDTKLAIPTVTPAVPEPCQGKCEDCGTCTSFWR